MNHQEVIKGSSLKSCCMPVCCDQGNEFGLNTTAMFVSWVSCCCMGDLCLFVDGNIAQNGRTSSIISTALVRDMEIRETLSGLTITKENAILLKVIEKSCHLLAFPNAKYQDTQLNF